VLGKLDGQELITFFQVMLDGFKPITTQIFDSEGDYLDNDSVFAVKDSLVVKFVRRKDDSKAGLELKYDILMVPNDEIGESEPEVRSSGMGTG
jgi:catechol 1,2-dioxygenase